MTNFKNLNLNEKILGALESKGYTTPTPIQDQAIPPILEGKDIFGIAQTGTGKTAAFSLPILHNLAKNPASLKSGGVRVLILTPTRELASQIEDNIKLYGKDLGLRYAVIFGGVSERPQIATMQRGVDILIATPGRLLDLTNQGYIRYMQLEVLVLDEADRMLDMGFINDIKKIIQKIPEKRQTLFFSATMPETITGLANSILKNPVKIEVTPASTTVERIDQKVLFVAKSHKTSLLKRILKDEAMTSALVFCKTKHGANKVVEFLEKNSMSVAAIHGNKSQGAREKALASFRSGEIKVLVATDIAARGIDIPAISHVINFDIPIDPESYVHRIGRTARAGLNGIAISLCDPSETKFLREVEKTIKQKIPVDESHAFHGVEAGPEDNSDERRAPRPSSNRPRRDGAAPSRERSERPRSSGARPDNRGGEGRRSPSAPRKDFRAKDDRGGEKKLFGFFGFGNKGAASGSGSSSRRDDDSRSEPRRFGAQDERRPRRQSSDERRPRTSSSNFTPRFGDEKPKKESFGFGGWFKNKKPDPSKSSLLNFDSMGERRTSRPNSDSNRSRSSFGAPAAKRSFSGNSGSRSGGTFGGGSRSGGGKKW